jgi:3-methyl-2-oxobutanoate hydroxymethyltransferase
VIQGHLTTIPVTINDMIYHTRAVAHGNQSALLMSDMPFMSYQASYEEAIANAGRLIKAGAQSVKLEGGEEMVDLVWYLNKIGIPVNAHIGLRPQAIHTMGGYKIQGQSKKDADALINEAQMFEEAGAFSLLLEGIPMEVAQKITESVTIPTIGIGSGPYCSGQVLVVYDLLGFNPTFKPRFVKNYANFYDQAQTAFAQYIKEVQEGTFPGEEHSVHRDLVEVKGIKRIK